ncbi:flavin-containing monooxygenase 5-like [Saccoglossus kowalevskii]|uniref:Flavin-containing monooxygenase n=1 Tax=Saccoglossus kowalevskii TaxID=10224 RepID=A0ABM0GYN0_SACKO|nr:PREDICTED: dimethylaniline monooxygenase [N-oxide-forming] 5-like [Saccoglossus kowalevskii]
MVIRKVAVIGAGASGLSAIKSCLEEGLEPICFEKGTDIGGLWNYHEDNRHGHASVFKSTTINTSKEIMAFSDFPIPSKYPNFMPHNYVLAYFRLYADRFKLLPYIKFNICVESIKPNADYALNGKWDICFRDVTKQEVVTQTFDAVLVCTGHHVDPNVPEFPGQDDFKGKIVHTHDYKNFYGYENKRVVVIGTGNSGGDAAVDLANVTSQVFLSTRRGTWVIFRIADSGLPGDFVGVRRYISEWLPESMLVGILEKMMNKRFDHALFGLLPKHRANQQQLMVNDALPNVIQTGRICVKPNVKRFTNTGVEFEDGTFEDGIDSVVMATGYKIKFTFLDESVVKVNDNEVSLYKYVFPPLLKHGTLAVIGLVQPIGSTVPIAEIQSRWATRVFTGAAKLPPKDIMLADINAKREAMASRYIKSQRYTIQVDYIPYMDEIAAQFGVRPNFKKLFFTDPKLAFKCYFGPFSTYQYRLIGPGKWEGARETIVTIWDRVAAPLNTRKVEMPQRDSSFGGILKMLVFLVAFLAVFWKCCQ